MSRMRDAPGLVERHLMQLAELDGVGTEIYIEQEPGSSGKTVIEHYIKLLANRAVRGDPVTGPKIERAKLLSAKAAAGKVKVVEGTWLSDFFDECDAFPMGSHDDQVDAVSGALARLFGGSYDTAIAYFEQRNADPAHQKYVNEYMAELNGDAVDKYLDELNGTKKEDS
jgi:predicted phage terminase large subunit-like protein